MAAEKYEDQVQLLVAALPFVAQEACFALKGGTAINLFYRDLPRQAHAQCLAVSLGPEAGDDQDFIDVVSDLDQP